MAQAVITVVADTEKTTMPVLILMQIVASSEYAVSWRLAIGSLTLCQCRNIISEFNFWKTVITLWIQATDSGQSLFFNN